MNINKYQLISIFLGIIIGLASTAIVYGWTNPTANPPGGTPGVLIRSGLNVGIGVTPTTRLDIDGQIRIRGGAPAVGRILTSTADGTATWAVPATGLPIGTSGQTLRHDGTSWIANSFLTNTGTRIGINTASPTARVSILGEGTTSATQALNVANSAGTSMLFVRDDGNVGIRTTGPISPLQVAGIATFGTGGAAAGGIGSVQITGSPGSPVSGRLTFGTDGTGWQFRIAQNQGGVITDHLTVLTGGNVGIGTTAPGARLEIFGTPGTQRITTIPSGTTGTYTLSWDAFQICQFGTCCAPWRDCDGDGRTYEGRADCDEGNAQCFVGSTACPATADGRDQNCNGVVDEACTVDMHWLTCQGLFWFQRSGGVCGTADDLAACQSACISAGFASANAAIVNCDPNKRAHVGVYCWGLRFNNGWLTDTTQRLMQCQCGGSGFR